MATVFQRLDIDPLDLELTTDDIEDDIVYHLDLFKFENQEAFKASLQKRYFNFNFDADDDIILWTNDKVRQRYLDCLDAKLKAMDAEYHSRKRKADELVENIGNEKEANTYDLIPKTVKSRNVVSHDQTVLHLRFCSLCNESCFKTNDEAMDHLYSVQHVNKLQECFHKGSQPRISMDTLRCCVCNSKAAKPSDINGSVFEHIASYAHAVKGISPPTYISRQLHLACRASLCTYYVNKQIPTHLAQQASGHVIGQASSSLFMSSGEKKLNKQELKHHPLRMSGTGNHIENEDTIYKSASFQTFCMTHGMMSDQVKTLWSWQPLFLPLNHIRGKCGLCKEQVAESLNVDKSVSNIAKMTHLNEALHTNHCAKEVVEIDNRLRFAVPVDVKCFILAYCQACKKGLGTWNSILTHILDKSHKAQLIKLLREQHEQKILTNE